jgi:hypothetical protein
MKKFGFSKKAADAGDDPNRSALFGKRGSPAPSDNPYAQQQPANDPYMNGNKYAPSYQQARAGGPGGPPGGLPGGPAARGGYGAPSIGRSSSNSSSATAPPPYSEQQSSNGYGNDKYGSSTGYGNSKYASAGGYGARGAGGYGGLGRTDSGDTDVNRDALLSGARDRYQQQKSTTSAGGYGQSGASAGSSGYGGYGEERELTQEEKEKLEVDDYKRQIYDTTKATKGSTTNARSHMDQAIATGLQTYARLGAQNERLHHTDQLLDRAVESNRDAEAKSKKLTDLNRSMFAVHVKNPFTAGRKTAEDDARVQAQNQEDRAIREAARRDKFAQNARMESKFSDINKAEAPSTFSRANNADRSKYELEDSDEDDEDAVANRRNNEAIERDIDAMMIGTRQLNMIARGMGEEVEAGNKVIDRIGSKSDHVSDRLQVTRNRLDKIR